MLNPLLFSAALLTAAPAPCPADTVCIARDTQSYSFRFTYPMAAARVAGLDGILREQATDAEAALIAAAEAGGHDGRLRFESHYRLDANLPEIIALTGTVEGWDGARTRTVMFDPRNRERLDLISLFGAETFDNFFFWSRPRGIRAAQDSFCHALSAAVRERRAELQLRELDIACPDIEDQPVTTICNGRGRILALRAYVTPEASRGVDPEVPQPYVVDFDMTAEMIGVMKQRYRIAFGLPGETRGRGRRTCPAA
ncbi:MAG TPA: hypothetical protein VMG08_15835 [Allosphingosinicella sp.]|nr:hypothetical protein [Allosphingosinicella sp.]